VLDSGCTNHMVGERRIFTDFEKNIVKVIASNLVTIAKAKSLSLVKLLSQSNIQFLKFFLLNRWTTIYYPFHNVVRWVIIVCSPIRVSPSLEEVMIPLPVKVS
jgi:uncharacterized membrane protein